MKELESGVYEMVINQAIEHLIGNKDIVREDISSDHLPEALAAYLKQIIRTTIKNLEEKDADSWKNNSVELVNAVIKALTPYTNRSDFSENELASSELLKAVNTPGRTLARPMTSLSETSLIVGGAKDSPTLIEELKKEITSADEIYWMVSFIRNSGLISLLEELQKFTQRGKFKVLTTTYIGATELAAMRQLMSLSKENTEVKIEYDGKHSRLHAKVYYFKRKNGFSTAYIGSSNISKDALKDGLEWNVKLTQQENPAIFKRIELLFDDYWQQPTFEAFTGTDEDYARFKEAIARSKDRSSSEIKHKYFFNLKPFPYQEEILEAIAAQRAQGINKNLVVAATGTGKTAISAFDYQRLCEKEKRKIPLLFLAHRKEILEQARNCFQEVLHDDQFGELWVDGNIPQDYTHVFASVQSLNAKQLETLSADQFEMIIIDEAHHMSADSYQRIVKHFTGFRYLLGLTATPERMDGQSITDDFEHRITAEIRLPDAIDRQLLVPFNYFIQDDPVSLADCKWTNGGYDANSLQALYMDGKDALKRVDKIIKSIQTYLPDIENLKAIAFCAGVRHAEFMAKCFNEVGIASRCIAGTTAREDRAAIRDDLKKGAVKIVTAVDVFNEGVDLPFLNSVLFLRPTQSLTIFLQQLGRGLRLWEGKDALTVLDFVGVGNTRYNFESRLRALFRTRGESVGRQIATEQYRLPIGCTFSLQKRSREIILENIKKSFSGLAAYRQQLTWFLDEKGEDEASLRAFLEYRGVDPLTFYANIKSVGSFAGLLSTVMKGSAPLQRPSYCINDKQIGSLMMRLSQIDDHDNLVEFDKILRFGIKDDTSEVILRFFYTYLKSDGPGLDDPRPVIEEALNIPWLRKEMQELVEMLLDRVRLPLDSLFWKQGEEFPLHLHGTYTKAQIFTSLCPSIKRAPPTGVFYDAEHRIDLLFVTINKSEKNFTPNTLYDDYAISHELFHWESQSTTTESSETGRRYIEHDAMGSRVLLFVREKKNSDVTGEAMPYRCFGFCHYMNHEGERPMKILWRLEKPLNAKLLREAKPINNT